jgi:hypothetical protein
MHSETTEKQVTIFQAQLPTRRDRIGLALAVMLIDTSRRQTEQTTHLFRPLRGTVFSQNAFNDWARRQIGKLPRSSREGALFS